MVGARLDCTSDDPFVQARAKSELDSNAARTIQVLVQPPIVTRHPSKIMENVDEIPPAA
jgi:hypothetical protein